MKKTLTLYLFIFTLINTQAKNTNHNLVSKHTRFKISKIFVGDTLLDLTTKTTNALCAEMTKGDTIISVNGSSICVNSYQTDYKKVGLAVLNVNCNFELNGIIFPIKANELIIYNYINGNLMQGTLRSKFTYTTNAGEIVLKEGSIISIKDKKVIGGSLDKNTILKIGNTTIECSPNSKFNNDIKFDINGKLKECTIANDLEWKTDIALTFPKMSRIKFSYEKLYKVILSAPNTFTLNGRTINVKGNNYTCSYELDDAGDLYEAVSGPLNSIDIEGQSVAIKENSIISFTNENGKTVISKIIAAETVTINVYNGDSSQKTTVNPGQSIEIKNGKVIYVADSLEF